MRELVGPGTSAAVSGAAAGMPPATRGRRHAAIAAELAAVIIMAVGAAAGLWFVPFVVGLAAGATARRGRLRVVLPVTAAAAAAGWAMPLAWLAWRGEPVGTTARSVGALAGLPASAALVVSITLLVAVVQAVTGMGIARAVRAVGRRAAAGQQGPSGLDLPPDHR